MNELGIILLVFAGVFGSGLLIWCAVCVLQDAYIRRRKEHRRARQA